MKEEYKQIAAYESEDFLAALQRIASEPNFIRVLQKICHEQTHDRLTVERLLPIICGAKDLKELDKQVVFKGLFWLADHTGTCLKLEGTENLNAPALFITNHRDIILDAAFLSILTYPFINGRIYMGIGTNLYVQPWIEDVVRINKCFSVIRGGNPRELLEHSQLMSKYIHYELEDEHHCVWIAQREGRAKDGNDITQPAILKMLTMTRERDFIENARHLNITPISLSYEYDPCDYLKAREFQLKRDDANYKKCPGDDYKSMQTGIFGRKGKMIFRVTPSINAELDAIREQTNVRNEQISLAAQLIDKHIHANYEIYNVNRIADDLLTGEHKWVKCYTEQEKIEFESYINGQIAKIDLPEKDYDFLRFKMLEMYANPLRNYLKQHNP